MKFLIRTIKHTPGVLGENLKGAVPNDLRAQVRSGGRMSWYPAQVLADVSNCIHRVGGNGGSREVWRRFFFDSIDFPLVKPLASSAVRLFGPTPGALARRTPQAWNLVTRHCADMRAHVANGEPAVLFQVRDLAAPLQTEAMLAMFYGGFRAQMDFLQTTGDVSHSYQNRTHGDIDFEISWS